jgi:hypothetical protein
MRLRLAGPASKRRSRAMERDVRSASDRLGWDPPATVISVAGLHGGAGATTLCLLLAEAVATLGNAPAVAIDLAGPSRGGLAVHGGAAGQTTAEGICAVAAIHGGRLEHPFGVNRHGVRIIGAHPDGVEELDRSHETLAARLVEAVASGADDTRLAELARLAVREDRSWQALRWDNEEMAEAVVGLLDQAGQAHALLTLDLGMLDGNLLAEMAAMRSHLHVWALPGRAASLEIAERRLPLLPFETTGCEAVAVWKADGQSPSAKRLSRLGDLRGCPVVRVANHGNPGSDRSERMLRCLSGITELCELAR